MGLRTQSFSDPGKPDGANEDISGSSRLSAWVLDGATGLGDGPLLPVESDAAWLAAQFNGSLHVNADRVDRDLPDLFRDSVTEVAKKFAALARRPPVGRFEEPSAGLAIVRLRGARLEYATLGDCKVILSVGDDVISTVDSPVLRRFDAEVIAKMQAVRDRDDELDIETIRGAMRSELRANRSQLNTEAGYWALGIEPAAANALEVGSVSLRVAKSIWGLLLSDGFYRLVDTFKVYENDAALLKAVRLHGLKALVAQLRALEDKDPQCRQPMRIKPKDDATVLLFEVCAGI